MAKINKHIYMTVVAFLKTAEAITNNTLQITELVKQRQEIEDKIEKLKSQRAKDIAWVLNRETTDSERELFFKALDCTEGFN